MVPLLQDEFYSVRIQAITSLGDIAAKNVNLAQSILSKLYPLLENSLISLRQITIETLSQLLPKLPEAEQTDLINHFKDIVLKQTDYFGLQMKALRALQPLKPEQIAPLVKEIVQHFATTSDQKNNYLILEINHIK